MGLNQEMATRLADERMAEWRRLGHAQWRSMLNDRDLRQVVGDEEKRYRVVSYALDDDDDRVRLVVDGPTSAIELDGGCGDGGRPTRDKPGTNGDHRADDFAQQRTQDQLVQVGFGGGGVPDDVWWRGGAVSAEPPAGVLVPSVANFGWTQGEFSVSGDGPAT